MKAIILAGGLGSRLSKDRPKALVTLNGKPIIAYQLDYLFNVGKVEQVTLAIGHKSGEIIDFVEKYYEKRSIEYAVEERKLGTAGALRFALQTIPVDGQVLVLNADDIANVNLQRLTDASQGENTICRANPELPYGLIETGTDGYISKFVEKPVLKDKWVSIGWYLLNAQQIFPLLPEEGDLEKLVFPKLKMRTYDHVGFWKSVNTDKDIKSFEDAELPSEYKI